MNHWSRTGAEETGRAGDVPPEGCTSRFANVDSRAEETGAGGGRTSRLAKVYLYHDGDLHHGAGQDDTGRAQAA
jgi:hypothetical protein